MWKRVVLPVLIGLPLVAAWPFICVAALVLGVVYFVGLLAWSTGEAMLDLFGIARTTTGEPK